jgi:5-methylthioadenosine/S-adenosylhomocysteine deaminase
MEWKGGRAHRRAVRSARGDTCSDAFLKRISFQAEKRNAIVNTHLGQSELEVERVKARTGKTSAQV